MVRRERRERGRLVRRRVEVREKEVMTMEALC